MPDSFGKPERKARRESLIYVAAIFALAGLAAWAALAEGDARRAGLATLAAVALVAGGTPGLLAAVPAALLGEWAIAALAAAGALATFYRVLLQSIPRRRRDDHEALAGALGALPSDLLYALRIGGDGRPLTTWHLVEFAARTSPRQWQSLLADDPKEGAWDGPVLDLGDSGRATLFAAEAAGLSAVLAKRFDRPVDADLLALAACSIPLCAATEWITDLEPAVDALVAAPLIDAVECVSKFSVTAAGRDVYRRAQLGYWARRLAIDDRELAYEFRITGLPRFAWQVLRA